MMQKVRNLREYPVWQDAVELSTYVYRVTGQLPNFEQKGLCDQLRRAVVSIASNIAEGSGRTTDSEFARFLDIAVGSCYEVETQLLIAKNVGYIEEQIYTEIENKIIHVESQIVRLLKKVRE